MRSRALWGCVLGVALVLGALSPGALAAHRLPAASKARWFWNAARVHQALLHPAAITGRRGSYEEGRWPPSARSGAGHAPSRLGPRGPVARTSSLRVAESTAVEDRAFGRIFAIDPRFGPYSCSGTSLATPSGSIVLTAGHCVVEGHRWGRHIVFVPAFDHGARPFGSFVAEALYTPRQWRRSENPDFDVAAFSVARNSTGTLSETVGARPYETGRSRHSAFQLFGYPAAALAGRELRTCLSDGLGSDPRTFGFGGPPTIPARCDMAPGSSGGPWIADGGYIDGVTSYFYPEEFGRLYSPYFGAAIGSFLGQLP